MRDRLNIQTLSAGRVKPRGAQRAGFTLTELLVAIAIVALLTLAIGQIFRSIARIVSVGTASTEVDQLARTLERQLRDDFDAFNRMRSDETFLALRMREIGDANHDGVVQENLGEVALYLTPEDRDADVRDGYTPYQRDAAGKQIGRAVTRRADDMCFLAFAGEGGGYTSVEYDRIKATGDRNARLVPPVRAEAARIYWGHALRPAPDPNWPPTIPNLPTAPRIPDRQYYPDGDLGQEAGKHNRYAATGGLQNVSVEQRNAFASQWTLARQPLLLYGGTAAGYTQSAGRSIAPVGNGREYAPYIRDTETLARLGGTGADTDLQGIRSELDIVDRLSDPFYPEPRVISWGRVDICAQDLRDVRRWLEGEAPTWMPSGSTSQPSSVPFAEGSLREQQNGDASSALLDEINSPLWRRYDAMNHPGPSGGAPSFNVRRDNLQGVRSAIAGVFARPQSDPSATPIDRSPIDQRSQPEDALMDLHAALATHCSNFEIAWSDGSVALRDVDLDSNVANGPEMRRGDVIWFDLTPLNPTNANPERSTYREWATRSAGDAELKTYRPNPSGGTTARFPFPDAFPELGIDAGGQLEVEDTHLLGRLYIPPGGGAPPGSYYPDITGGATRNEIEYMAIWGFRLPASDGGYSIPGGGSNTWAKNILLRVRVTLHDSQNRLKDGKKFEFIFRLNPEGQ